MFAHLHCHSNFSFNAGTAPVKMLAKLAKESGMTSLALTETNNMSGAIEFYRAMKALELNPILGVELKSTNERAVLLARNNDGYREICETVTNVIAAIPTIKPKLTLEDMSDEKPIEPRGRTRKPAIIEAEEPERPLADLLMELSDNVYILSSTASLLRTLAPRHAHHLYIELIPSERKEWKQLREVCRDYALEVVSTNNVILGTPRDHALHKLLRAIGTNTTIGNTPGYEIADPSQYFTTERQQRDMMGNVAERAFSNTMKIAADCNVTFDMSYSKFAKFACDDPNQLLRELSEQGLKRKFAKLTQEHNTRFEFELSAIRTAGAESYFLAVHDMIQFAKHKGFPYLGRGSGANSLIAYTLGISNVDPVANNLRFERFLNPERTSAPDFDIDFSWRDRYEVIHYMLDKYGKENSAMLSTIQCYRDRGTVREVGKALGYTEAEINERIAGVRLVKSVVPKPEESSQELLKVAESGALPDVQDWMRWAGQIHGYPRHLSVHAGGIIIGDKPLSNYTATQLAPIGVPISHIDMFSAEDLKLIKLDILATRGLGTYWDTMRMVEERTGVRPPVEDERIAFADEPTRAIIREGRSKGCFYIESPAMISLLRKLRTDTFENLTAASSVIRPGVSQSGMMQEFIKRHRNPASVKHVHPLLGELMKETYGVMVYQEDVLIVAHEFAGLSYGQADLFRRAMSGKLRSHERMSEMEETFVKGCLKNGITEPIGREVWRQVASFGGYSFCKAHSASYAVLSFQEAWLKVHHPAEFMCSVLNNFGGFYNHQEYIIEARRLGVRVLLPDVNKSAFLHTVEAPMTIRLGMVAYRDVSSHSIDAIFASREAGGAFHSIEDFAERSGVLPEDGSILIQTGACDSFITSRAKANLTFTLLRRHSPKRAPRTRATNNPHALPSHTRQPSREYAQQGLDFAPEVLPYDLSHISDAQPIALFHLEKKYLGYAVSCMPNDFLRHAKRDTVPSSLIAKHIRKTVTVAGYISATKPTTTRKGDRMLMLNLSDNEGMMDVVIWPEQFRKYYTVLATSQALRIKAKVSESFDVPSLEALTIEGIEFEEAASNPIYPAERFSESVN